MIPRLPDSFLKRPIAHRGLHDIGAGRPENSLEAVSAAIDQGFAIEIDIQMSADCSAVVFHDYTLDRLTDAHGSVRDFAAIDLNQMALSGGAGTIPSLSDVLTLVDGRVALLIEIKDQDGALGADVGHLEMSVARALEGYDGDVAVMSYNPHSVSAMQVLQPKIPRGLVTEQFEPEKWKIDEAMATRLNEISDYERVGATFISHDVGDLKNARVRDLKEHGATILCWTVRSQLQQDEALKIADNITFEGYLPAP